MTDKKKIVYPAILVFLLLVTNRWMSWDTGIDLLQKQDVLAYSLISEAAPGFPTDAIAYHHAQRLFWPYLIGVLAKITMIHYSIFFTLFYFVFFIITIFAIQHFLRLHDLTDDLYLISFSILIFNPYFFRYYAIVPGMLQGVVFNLSVLLIVISLIRNKFYLLMISLILATLSRQTIILIVPMITLWIYYGKGWSQKSRVNRVLKILMSIFIVFLIYYVSGQIAESFSNAPHNVRHMTELFTWIGSGNFSFGLLGEFTFRSALPLLIPVSVIFVCSLQKEFQRKILTIEVVTTITAGILMVSQSVLSGPELGGKSAARLASHGMVPIWAAMIMVLSGSGLKFGNLEKSILYMSVFFLSLHHIYTIIGPASAFQFASLYSASAIFIAIIFYREIRKSMKNFPVEL